MKSINIQRAGGNGQAGFTIIELVVVILLLGILTATALPRFINVTDEAHTAVVDAVLGGLGTSGALFRAEFVGQGGTSTTVGNFSVIASATTGYPSVTDDASCVSAFNALLQGGRPTISAKAIANSAAYGVNAGEGTDFLGGFASPHCVYTYIADAVSGAAGTKTVVWNTSSGEIERK